MEVLLHHVLVDHDSRRELRGKAINPTGDFRDVLLEEITFEFLLYRW